MPYDSRKFIWAVSYGPYLPSSFEIFIKLIALGLVFHEDSFLRSIWNILDLIVVVGAILDLVLVGDAPGRDCEDELTLALIPQCGLLQDDEVNLGADVGFIKTLRVFRVLRPLKSVQRIPKESLCNISYNDLMKVSYISL